MSKRDVTVESDLQLEVAQSVPVHLTEGPPKDFCTTTLRPVGPIVRATARAICSTPLRNSCWASESNFICLVMMVSSREWAAPGGAGVVRNNTDDTVLWRAPAA